jgi:D-glycerate 3-kinase
LPPDDRSIAVRGPAFGAVAALAPIDWDRWGLAARRLEGLLAGSAGLAERIHHLSLPVLFACLAWRQHADGRPLVVGLQAPQGAGKTTLVTTLLDVLPSCGLRGAAVSIDDFYLTRAEQLALAAAHPGNPFLEHRGYPGTHDLDLGVRTIRALAALGPGRRDRVPVPGYDKSAHAGRGDRRPSSEWRVIDGPLDLVFVEGWMLGYTPVDESALADRRLAAPNQALARYAAWHDQLDAFIVLRMREPSSVVTWRVQAEDAMRARGLPGLDRSAIEDYIRRFLPAYATWGGAPARFGPADTLTIWLDEARRPVRPTDGSEN